MTTYPQGFAICGSTGPSVQPGMCVPKLVAAQAARRSDAAAVALGAQVLTYHDLDSRANRVARYLRSLGVGADVLVGLCLPRSLDMVVAALGIMKAGGVYVPMDPAYPPDRLAYMLDDAQAPVVITDSNLAERFPASRRAVVDIAAPEIEVMSDLPPRTEVMPDDLAYVIYTSGSTGKPKGVEITHAGLMNLVSWHNHAFAVTSADRASHVAGLGFDAAVWELWPYLATGASIQLVDEMTRNSPELLQEWLLSEGITISFVPTPLAERLLTLEWPRETALRTLLTGGDTLHHYPPANLPFELVNNYGPTECTVVATSVRVLPDSSPGGLPPIGRPIANVRIYLLDERLEPVPADVPGEIYIGGASLARGYHNRPDLTAERFIQDPFSPEPGSRLYKTGDLGRLLPDGQVAFLGRADDQIKIRGYRIEPNEIVSALDRHPDIRESLVVAREGASGDKRLIAYVVPAGDSLPTHTALQNFIRDCLPEYMVPATFVRLEAFPLTSHGKIDRAALPEPTAENTIGEDAFEAPRSLVEERLTSILKTLLSVEQIGIDDNFFQMGGHSLLGAQLIARVRDTFGVELSLRSLFDHPTVREMSTEIERLIFAKLEAMGADEARHTPACPESANA
jgi:amino acid adenylation domain-containing protein